MRRIALPLATALALVGLAVAPASADTGQQGCPPPFKPITVEVAYTLPHYAGLTHGQIDAIFASINKNGDAYICLEPLPLKDGSVNLIDNHSAIY